MEEEEEEERAESLLSRLTNPICSFPHRMRELGRVVFKVPVSHQEPLS